MKTLALIVALSLPTAACVVGSDEPIGDGDGDGSGNGDGTGGGNGDGTGGGQASNITADVTWSGAFDVSQSLTIAPGVTVTVEAGTTVTFAPNTSLTVNGVFDAQGTKAAPVVIGTAAANQFFIGFNVPTGGEVKLNYVNQTGGGIRTSGGKATVLDSYMSGANGDFLVMTGGTVDIQYSQIGREIGETDTTHCDMHFDGTMPNIITVSHSNISTTDYGLMFYSGTNANFTFNNWFGNVTDVSTSPGVQGDFSNGWFEKTPPPVTGQGGAQLTLNTLSATRLLDAGPR